VQDRDDSILDLEPLRQRAEGVRDWLTEKGRGCFEEQKHTRADTQEKIYLEKPATSGIKPSFLSWQNRTRVYLISSTIF
jgi:hypothetical protein